MNAASSSRVLADWNALIWANRAVLEATRTQRRLTTVSPFISGYLEGYNGL